MIIAIYIASWKRGEQMKADLIIKSDCIFDSISAEPYPGFVAVKGNRILAVERGSDPSAYQGQDTVVKEFGANTVMAGFHDSHTHLIMAGLFKTYVNLAEAKSEEEAALMVKKAADKDPDKTGWVRGFSWYHVFWDNRQMPTHASLDKYFPDRPVCLLHAEAHGAWINSAAMKIIGLTADTPDPAGGKIVRDTNGDPTGVLLEAATGLATRYAFDFTEQEEKAIIHAFMDAAKNLGITSINDVQPYYHGNMGDLEVYSQMDRAGELTVRIHAAPDLTGDLDKVVEDREKYSSDKLKVDQVKQFLDGVVTTHTALVLDEYADEPGNIGEELCDLDSISKAVPEAHKRGLSVKLHACGDRAVRYGIDYIETAVRTYGKNQCRHAIEHLEMVSDDDFSRIKELGIIPSVQPEHLALTQTFDANPYPEVLGKKRADKAFPYRSLYEAAGILAIGSDCPVVDNDPFLEIFRGITRVHNDGKPEGGWTPSEKLTLAEMLKFYTHGSAYGVHRENELGSLAEGYFADIIVIDKDLFSIPDTDLMERKVIMTVMDGKIIYEDPASV